MKKFDRLYNLIMEDINPVKKQAWQDKFKEFPQMATYNKDVKGEKEKYIDCWAIQNWQLSPKDIDSLGEEQMWKLWNKFMWNAPNYVRFFMGVTEPEKADILVRQVRYDMAQTEAEEHKGDVFALESVLTESCFDDGTYDELYEWYDQDLVSAVLDVLSKYDQFLPPRTVARLINDKEIKEEFEKGKLKDLSEGFIKYKINPRYNAAYGWEKYNK